MSSVGRVPTTETLLGFAVVAAGLMVLPGPSNFFILAHGIGHGPRAALDAVLGIAAASAIRVALTAAGLAALLASSAIAFQIMRWLGVAYLMYLGVIAWRSAHAGPDATAVCSRPARRRSFAKGLLVGLSNPKMVLFFVAFFPQFIDPERGSAVTQMLVLGAIFWMIGTVWDVGCALGSGAIGDFLRRRPRIRALQGRAEGTLYFGLAAWTVATGSRSRP
jgi:threonine/homoserine/homoserine lactone efflux protein